MFWDKYVALSDEELLRAADDWAESDRRRTLDILGILIALDDRDLPTRKGHPGLFKFCTERLRFSEAMAFWRIRTARAAKQYPKVAELLESGEMNITTVTILSHYLSPENSDDLLSQAAGKTRKEVESLIASLQPSAPRRDVVVKCGPAVIAKAEWPEPAATAPAADGGAAGGGAAEQRALDVVEAIDAERRRLHFDVGPDTAQLLERAREILRHKFPFASLEDIVREALNVLLTEKDFDRDEGSAEGTPGEGKDGSRNIPMWVRRAVWRRDGGRCVFVGEEGRTCGERSWLEFDHVVPFGQGGRSDDPANVRLLCRAHNRAAADRAWGAAGGGTA